MATIQTFKSRVAVTSWRSVMSDAWLLPAAIGHDTIEGLGAELGPRRPLVYWLALIGCVTGLLALPLVTVNGADDSNR
jgi:hypothetical protein